MKFWLRKIFVAFVAVITLGFYIPPLDLQPNETNAKDAESLYDEFYAPTSLVPKQEIIDDDSSSSIVSLEQFTNKAKLQTKRKLGPKIFQEVEQELTEVIFPKLEAVLKDMYEERGEEEALYLEITENPSGGIGERIFDVYDHREEKIVMKFHVRREKRPLEGYWFNFHYHFFDDRFEKHYDIGEVYWAKNDPPYWMSS